MIEGYCTVQEMSIKWNIGVRHIQQMCAAGRISGAVKFGKNWAIPEGTKRPNDGRITSGKYRDWRKKGEGDNGNKGR